MTLLQGRRGLVIGIANRRSIAFGIAKACHEAGAELALTYQSAKLASRVRPLAEELEAPICKELDVTEQEPLNALGNEIEERFGRLDFLVHAVASARREELEGRFVDTSLAGFRHAMEVSVYSLVALTKRFEKLLADAGGSVLTLSYYGANKALPHYNIMGVAKAALEAQVRYLAADLGPCGIRVNAISAGAVKTLSGSGIRGFRSMLAHVGACAPLRRNVSVEEIGRAALYPLSDLGSATTGEVIHVDAGYHALGAPGIVAR